MSRRPWRVRAPSGRPYTVRVAVAREPEERRRRGGAALPSRLRTVVTVAAWVCAAGAVGGVLLHAVMGLPRGPRDWADGYIYLGAASDLFSHPGHIYDAAHLQVMSPGPQRAFLVPPSGMLPFLLLVPLTRLAGLNPATAVWMTIDTAALFTALVLVARRIGLDRLTLGIALFLVALSQPVQWEVGSAQFNGVVLLLMVLSMRSFPRLGSGLLMGLALALKPTAVLVLLVPLLLRRPRVTVLALTTVVAANLVFVPILGVSTAVYWATSVAPYMLGYVMHDPTNMSLASVVQTWLGGGALPRYGALSVGVPRGLGGIAVVWGARLCFVAAWLRVTIDRRVDAVAAMCLALAVVPIFTATVWPHYLVYVMPLALLTLRAPQPWARAAAFLSLVAMLWPGRADGLWIGLLLLYPAAVGALLIQSGWRPAALRSWVGSVRMRASG